MRKLGLCDATNRKYKIQELRVRNGLTQKELADLIGVSVQTINAWEANPKKIKAGSLLALSRVFNESLESFYLG